MIRKNTYRLLVLALNGILLYSCQNDDKAYNSNLIYKLDS